MNVRRIIREVHRRSLWQVLSLYVLGAWVVYQVVVDLTQGLGLPPWVPGLAFVLFIVGLPVVVATAFVQQGLPRRRTVPAPELTLVSDVAEATAAGTVPAPREQPSALPPSLARTLTWPRALLGGVAAVGLLLVTAGGYAGLRTLDATPLATLLARGAVADGETVLIADFEATGTDPALAAAVTEALRVDLEQSSVLRPVPPREVAEALVRMGREASERPTKGIAPELAERLGLRLLVMGDIAAAGSGYLITVRLQSVGDGSSLLSLRERARGPDDVIDAVDRLSRRVRERAGESLGALRSTPRLADVTTSSLEALRLYTRARSAYAAMNWESARRLAEQAVAEDSTFATAWRLLSLIHGVSGGSPEHAVAAARRAYELRHRLPELERLHASAFYHYQIGDPAASELYRTILDRDSTDFVALTNLAILTARAGTVADAYPLMKRVLARDSTHVGRWYNVLAPAYAVDGPDTVRVLLERMRRHHPEHPLTNGLGSALASVEGDYDRAVSLARDARERSDEPIPRMRLTQMVAGVAALRGDLATFAAEQDRVERINRDRNASTAAVERALVGAEADLFIRRDAPAAIRRLDAAMSAASLGAVPAADRPYAEAARLYATAGRLTEARDLLERMQREHSAEVRGFRSRGELRARAWIALREDRVGDAIDMMRRSASPVDCAICAVAQRALIFDAAAMPDSARAAFQEYVDTRVLYRVPEADWLYLPLAHERLAELYADAGDLERARYHAGRFVELWLNADPELQPRVRAKQQMLNTLTRS